MIFSILLFVGYVLVLWGFSAVVKGYHGKVELIKLNNKVVGAVNIGQQFTRKSYFWGRPSAVNYNGSNSGGSNKSSSNPEYIHEIKTRIDRFLVAHPYLEKKSIPSELVTASGSGLDPHISPAAAEIQIRRVAIARGLSINAVKKIVEKQTHRPLIGPPTINVLKLNVALDNSTNN